MKVLLRASCVLALMLVTVMTMQAQDDYKGFYVGGTVGPTFSRGDYQNTTVFSPTGYFAASSVPAIASAGAMRLDSAGYNLAFVGGYNWRNNHLVLGVEGDIGQLYMRDFNENGNVYPCCGPTSFQIRSSLETNWMFTGRGRIGYADSDDGWLVYATGGVAIAGTSASSLFTDTFATATESGSLDEMRTGWTAGAGVEKKVGKHWSARVEYLYADFGSGSYTSTNLTAFTPPIAFPTNVFTHSYDLQTHVVRFGINYHFHP